MRITELGQDAPFAAGKEVRGYQIDTISGYLFFIPPSAATVRFSLPARHLHDRPQRFPEFGQPLYPIKRDVLFRERLTPEALETP